MEVSTPTPRQSPTNTAADSGPNQRWTHANTAIDNNTMPISSGFVKVAPFVGLRGPLPGIVTYTSTNDRKGEGQVMKAGGEVLPSEYWFGRVGT